jgi:ATP-dependent DNA ligase
MNWNNFRAMLCAHDNLTADMLDKLNYPVMVSFKYNGVRALSHGTAGMFGRSNKKHVNVGLHHQFDSPILEGLDGELILGKNPVLKDVFRLTSSMTRSVYTSVPFSFWVFDCVDCGGNFDTRQRAIYSRVSSFKSFNPASMINIVKQFPCFCPEDVLFYEAEAVKQGYEGIVVRGSLASGTYKNGRATAAEQLLFRMKRKETDEGLIIGMEELMTNTNEQVIDERGLAKRSKESAGLVGAGMMGKLVLQLRSGKVVRVGTGFTDAVRLQLWKKHWQYIGKLWAKFSYYPQEILNLPTSAVFEGIVDSNDIEV